MEQQIRCVKKFNKCNNPTTTSMLLLTIIDKHEITDIIITYTTTKIILAHKKD